MYYGGEIFFEILGDAEGSDQIRKTKSAVVLKLGLGLKVHRIARGWLARRQLRRLRLRQATSLIRGSPEAIETMGLPQWQGWAAVHSANGFKDYSGALSIVYVSRCDNKNVGRPNIVDLATHMAIYQPVLITDGGPNIVDLATHMAKYQPVLTELQVRVKVFDSDTAPDLNTAPDTAGNARGSGENCESQFELNHIRGGGRETQDGK